MRSINIVIFVCILVHGHALPTTEDASFALIAKRCHTETYGDNGGTTYTSGDCTGYTFSGTNVVNTDDLMDNNTATPKRDCTISSEKECSRSTYDNTIEEPVASNATASGKAMADRSLERVVHPPECQTIFEDWIDPRNVYLHASTESRTSEGIARPKLKAPFATLSPTDKDLEPLHR